MTDLREAQLRQEFRSEIMRGYQAALCNSDVPGWTLGDEVGKVADNLLASLADRPGEHWNARIIREESEARQRYLDGEEEYSDAVDHPQADPVPAQVEITDEAATLVGEAWDDGNAMGLDGYVGPNRGAGDVDPEAERARERMVDRAAALPYVVPRPLLDKEALGAVLLSFGADVRLNSERPAEMLGMAVDAVLELVRPMPTRQQIATVLHDGTHGRLQCSGPNCYIWDESYKSADLVLSLLGGES